VVLLTPKFGNGFSLMDPYKKDMEIADFLRIGCLKEFVGYQNTQGTQQGIKYGTPHVC
jgi:hypothetical protein